MFKSAENQTAYLKAGFYGFQGSGKTHTSLEFAKGICKLTNNNVVGFFDTEKGSDFHVDRLKKAGFDLRVIKSKNFGELLEAIPYAEKNKFGFLVIDSVTHIWQGLCRARLAAKEAKVRSYKNIPANKKVDVNLTMKDWGALKEEWAKFTELFVNSNLHIAACGRAGYEYDFHEDEEGNQEIKKSGTKMKAEGEFGYESDLLIEMFTEKVAAEPGKRKSKEVFINKCLVLKDRTDLMNAQIITKPTFKHFEKVITSLNIGGEHVGAKLDISKNNQFVDGDKTIQRMDTLKQIQLEKLQEALVLAGLDGTSAVAKKERAESLIGVFKTSSKTEIEDMSLEKLEAGVILLKKRFGQLPADPPANNGVDTTEQLF